jgi:hypothetical protein
MLCTAFKLLVPFLSIGSTIILQYKITEVKSGVQSVTEDLLAKRVRTSSTKTRMGVPWLRRLVAGLLPRRTKFAPGSVHMEFVVD